jgi:hypothetical protein
MAASASTLLVATSPSLAIIIVDHTSSELGPFCDLSWFRLA